MLVDLVFAAFDVLAWMLLVALASGWWKLRRILIELHLELGVRRGRPERPRRGTGGKRPLSEGENEPPP